MLERFREKGRQNRARRVIQKVEEHLSEEEKAVLEKGFGLSPEDIELFPEAHVVFTATSKVKHLRAGRKLVTKNFGNFERMVNIDLAKKRLQSIKENGSVPWPQVEERLLK